jgi:uncharacterized protein YbaR (Trm112 family)
VKENLMEILACPLCKGDLILNVKNKKDDEIISGTLYCKKCNAYYPIDEGIPNMLPPHLRE